MSVILGFLDIAGLEGIVSGILIGVVFLMCLFIVFHFSRTSRNDGPRGL